MGEFDEKSRLAHGGFYLTLVSIMQSLALGYLLQLLGNELIDNGTLPLNMVLQAITAVVMIILVWHVYAMGTIYYTWKLGILDSCVPYLIGICEYFVITSMAIPENKALGPIRFNLWLLSIAIFTFSGILAYLNQFLKARADVVPGKTNAIGIAKKSMLLSTGYFAFFVILAISSNFHPLPDNNKWIVSLIVCILFCFEAIRAGRVYAKAGSL